MSYCLIYQVIDTRSIVRSRGALTRGRHVSCRRATGPQLVTMGTRLICRPMPLESTIKRRPYLGRWGRRQGQEADFVVYGILWEPGNMAMF